jgi:hypothetical protein
MDIEHFVEDLHKIAKGQLIQTELDKPVAANRQDSNSNCQIIRFVH